MKMWCSWVTSATWRRNIGNGMLASATSPTMTEPLRGASMPANSRPIVDLPAPEGPTMASRSPGRIVSESPFKHVEARPVGVADVVHRDGLVAGSRPSVGRSSRTTETPTRRANDV